MAKVVVTFEDIANPDDPTNFGVRLSVETDRDGDSDALRTVPVTPSMLFGLTVKRIYERHVLENLIGFVCQDIMRNAGLSSRQMKACEETAMKACEEATVVDEKVIS
jgi:hypothetical protein